LVILRLSSHNEINLGDDISPEAINFIKSLLHRDPENRPTATEALKDPWLTQERVQPDGVDRNVSFLSRSSPFADKVPPKKLVKHDSDRVNAFRRFLQRIKDLKAHRNHPQSKVHDL
jgi:serine/threonine protein kinase